MNAPSLYDLNALPVAVMIYDADERLVAWNDNITHFYPTIAPYLHIGATLSELAVRFIDAAYDTEPGRRQALAASIVANCRLDNHCEVRESGARRLFSQHQRLPDGGIASLHTDISRLDTAQSSRQLLHDDFLLAAESIHIGIWDWHVTPDILQVNDTLLALTGQPRGEWHYSARFLMGLVHEEDRALLRETMQKASKHHRPVFECEIRVRNAEGQWRWMLLSGQVVTLSMAGEMERVIGTLQDITRR